MSAVFLYRQKKLKVKAPVWFSVLLVFFLLMNPVSGFCAQSTPEFDFTLPVPENDADRAYLGVSGASAFGLGQIDSPMVLVQIFSMYCPICQRDAVHANTVFNLIRADEKLKRRIRLIGIGAGNSDFETGFFKTTYNIEFPLFSDPEFMVHKKVGEVGTPHFFGLRILPDNTVRLFFSHPGEISDPEKFLQDLRNASEK